MSKDFQDADFLKIIIEKADLFDYLCWLENMSVKECGDGLPHICMSRDFKPFFAEQYIDAVRQAAKHDKDCHPD